MMYNNSTIVKNTHSIADKNQKNLNNKVNNIVNDEHINNVNNIVNDEQIFNKVTINKVNYNTIKNNNYSDIDSECDSNISDDSDDDSDNNDTNIDLDWKEQERNERELQDTISLYSYLPVHNLITK